CSPKAPSLLNLFHNIVQKQLELMEPNNQFLNSSAAFLANPVKGRVCPRFSTSRMLKRVSQNLTMKNICLGLLVGMVLASRVSAQPVFTNCPANTNLGCNPLSVPDCDPNVGAVDNCPQAGYLLVSSSDNNAIQRYNAATGAWIDAF